MLREKKPGSDRVIMPCTHGKTRTDAIVHAEEVIQMYLEAWQEEGQPIPQPQYLQTA
ncbi:type II toxin-antitoxin system HicB family antitoxin [Roseofilum casamattae]|uniref:Type II toxin-antitoxin system HicB family antitoxin n=1 Tax=Roseofilum casamattae BLCC-M143 TaxID=3022442 RepID=A0ABT7C2P9_9CYAN|nr:type II toxin-antitoxin system HicB family antitoxin [Roseofilum casamattae]MDJ1185317.1 type II toxin-antitoxin system HicB family antitoxin [Roseofilum casamattae BLCC-M143]